MCARFTQMYVINVNWCPTKANTSFYNVLKLTYSSTHQELSKFNNHLTTIHGSEDGWDMKVEGSQEHPVNIIWLLHIVVVLVKGLMKGLVFMEWSSENCWVAVDSTCAFSTCCLLNTHLIISPAVYCYTIWWTCCFTWHACRWVEYILWRLHLKMYVPLQLATNWLNNNIYPCASLPFKTLWLWLTSIHGFWHYLLINSISEKTT